MTAYSQDHRMLAISTPLGKDALLLEGFNGEEGMSRLFTFELTMISERPNIAFDDIVGKSVTVSVVLSSGAKRFFNGIICRFAQIAGEGVSGVETRFSHYRATMVPWPWLLTRTADSRIFQQMTVPEIVEKIFRDQGFSHFKLALHGRYDKRDYCVQYRETDFNFVSRLLEEEGIHYFFEHDKGGHTLILADSPSANPPCPNQQTARFLMDVGGRRDEDLLHSLEKTQEIRFGKYTLNDFNFETPNTGLKVETPSKHRVGPGERELYDYPGRYQNKAAGEHFSRIRMEEEEARITTITGAGNCRAFAGGYPFTLTNFYRREMNGKEYLLTMVNHRARQGWQDGAALDYGNLFTCIPIEAPFRPQCLSPKPVVQGAQTAIVVGPSGEEIHTDEHGRVKVQFHWDREGTKNEESSCWVRVSQLWAGAGWGAMFIPRIGHEVIVDFLEGDPDRPIITGRVYHGVNKPPYPLPAEMTKSTIKSNSSKGGGGFNELRFEDKKGSEEIFLHGQKDWNINILNDKSQTVGHDETLKVGNNRTKTVGVDQSESIGSNKSIQVGKNHTETIGANMTTKVGDNYSLNVGDETRITCGASSIVMKSNGTIEIIGQDVTFRTAAGKVHIDAGGIVTAKGALVKINP